MEHTKIKAKMPVRQILILAICRIAEPIALTSVFPYLPQMIESFNVPKNSVAKWAGIVSAVFSLSQAITGILWGCASDRLGRKPTIVVGAICAMLSSLMFGFSKSLTWAIVARALAGATNGNVGTYRTAVAEMIPQKELQPRAFSMMPLIYTTGSIFGPGLGGALANPVVNHPEIFGNSAFFRRYPYALPNMATSLLSLVGVVTGILFLKETLDARKRERDYGRVLGKMLVRGCRRVKAKIMWSSHGDESAPLLSKDSQRSATLTIHDDAVAHSRSRVKRPPPPTYREIFTRQTNINLITYTCLSFHAVTYDQLLPIFMHYPPQENRASNPQVRLPFKFTGGFGIDSERIGLIFTLYGICGLFIQFIIFPPVARRFGVLNSLKLASVLFPIAYILTPFTVLLPTSSQQTAMLLILLLKCWAVIFAFPCSSILLTNSAVSLRILGTLNGVATSISAVGRAVGPVFEGWMFSLGLENGYVIVPWWTLAAIAVLGMIPVWYLVEMEGFAGDDEVQSIHENAAAADPSIDDVEVEHVSQAIAVRQKHNKNEDGFKNDEDGFLSILPETGSWIPDRIEDALSTISPSSPLGLRSTWTGGSTTN